MSDDELRVLDRPDDTRYELVRGDEVISYASYRLDDGVVTIPHVETAPEHRGDGCADTLMAGIVADVRARGLRIRPLCPFAASFMRDNHDTHDVLAD